MTALPLLTLAPRINGQTPGAGQARTAGQPDAAYTAAGTPVMVFDYAPGAPLYLVTVLHIGERRYSWVVGSPARLVDFAGGVLHLSVQAELRPCIDGAQPPVTFSQIEATHDDDATPEPGG